MQADELKALRTALGMSRQELGDQLGLTATFIGMMERGEKAIERRTELAMLYFAQAPQDHSIVDRVLGQLAHDAVEAYKAGDQAAGERLGRAALSIRAAADLLARIGAAKDFGEAYNAAIEAAEAAQAKLAETA